jgi:hypothetical protein
MSVYEGPEVDTVTGFVSRLAELSAWFEINPLNAKFLFID